MAASDLAATCLCPQEVMAPSIHGTRQWYPAKKKNVSSKPVMPSNADGQQGGQHVVGPVTWDCLSMEKILLHVALKWVGPLVVFVSILRLAIQLKFLLLITHNFSCLLSIVGKKRFLALLNT